MEKYSVRESTAQEGEDGTAAQQEEDSAKAMQRLPLLIRVWKGGLTVNSRSTARTHVYL